MSQAEKSRRYNESPKGRARKAAYRQRNRDALRVADNARSVRERLALMARVDAVKVAAGCADCGYNAHAIALDFDHLGDDKDAGVSVLVHNRARWSRVAAEIAKCEVVCANCHRVRTATRGQHAGNPGRWTARPEGATPCPLTLPI